MAGDAETSSRSVEIRRQARQRLVSLRAARRQARGITETNTIEVNTELPASEAETAVDSLEFSSAQSEISGPDASNLRSEDLGTTAMTPFDTGHELSEAATKESNQVADMPEPMQNARLVWEDPSDAEIESSGVCKAAEGAPSIVSSSMSPQVQEFSKISAKATTKLVEQNLEAAELGPTKEDKHPEPNTLDAEADAQKTTMENSDLLNLPGAGEGLVWVLSRCSVHSMADLAAADQTKLTKDLGLIAQIFDVQYWIEFAQQNRKL